MTLGANTGFRFQDSMKRPPVSKQANNVPVVRGTIGGFIRVVHGGIYEYVLGGTLHPTSRRFHQKKKKLSPPPKHQIPNTTAAVAPKLWQLTRMWANCSGDSYHTDCSIILLAITHEFNRTKPSMSSSMSWVSGQGYKSDPVSHSRAVGDRCQHQ